MMLLITNTIANQESKEITVLQENWNMVSVQYKKTIDKEDLVIICDNKKFSWNEAVDDGLILDYLYGWDRIEQNYYDSDVFEPGEGYMVFAYQECILAK